MLAGTTGRRTWAKEFPPGRAMYAGLTSSFTDINVFGKNGTADREHYADFLDEAAVLLNKPALKEVGQKFRTSATAWEAVSQALLPDEVEPFRQTRELMLRQHRLFIEGGQANLEEIRAIDGRLAELKKQVTADFPLDEAGTNRLRENLAERITSVHDIEYEDITLLQQAMA
jgi:hypothetical protein